MKREHEHLRMVEALLFAAKEPLTLDEIKGRLPEGANVEAHLNTLAETYKGRGIELATAGGRWFFRTAGDLAFLLRTEVEQERKLSRAAIETLAIIAYHQPVTRAEIEEIRGVTISKGTLDILMEAGWVRPKGRRQTPGKPVTYGTTEEFLAHFSLAGIKDLPGFDELKAAGLLESVDKALSRLEKDMIANPDEGEEAGPDEEEESLFGDEDEAGEEETKAQAGPLRQR